MRLLLPQSGAGSNRVGIAHEALAKDLMRVLQDHEGIGVDAADQIFQLRDLAAADGAHDDLTAVSVIAAVRIQKRGAAFELACDLRDDLRVFVGDDECHGGIVQTVDHAVHDQRRDIQRQGRVERSGDVVEHDARQRDGDDVEDEHETAELQSAEALAQQLCHDVRAARGGACHKHEAKAESGQTAAVERRQHQIDFGNGNDRQKVEQNGAEQHAEHGADEEAPSKLLIAEQEQGDVDGGEICADAAEAEQLAQDHGDAGDAADVDVVRVQKEVEAE